MCGEFTDLLFRRVQLLQFGISAETNLKHGKLADSLSLIIKTGIGVYDMRALMFSVLFFISTVFSASAQLDVQPDILACKDEDNNIAIPACTVAIKKYSNNPELLSDLYMFRGLAYALKNQRKRGLKDYNRAIALNPNSATAFFLRGISYSTLNNNQLAIKDFQTASRLDPRNPDYLLSLAGVYNKLENDYMAFKYANEALITAPSSIEALKKRCLANYNLIEIDAALSDCSKVRDTLNLGSSELDNSEYDQVVGIIKRLNAFKIKKELSDKKR